MKKLLIIFAIALGMTSCRDLEEMNVNPNSPTESHPQLLLTNVEWTAPQEFIGTDPLYAIKMLVQTDGENAYQYYKWNRGDFDDFSTLRNVTKMMEEAERIEDQTYVALGKFFRAYYFYNLTLQFGDIPYTDALSGEVKENYQPAYTSQQEVFQGILAELAEGSDILKKSNTIIAGDIIYDGSVTLWRKLINAFRLKVMLTLSKKNGTNMATEFASVYANEPLMESMDESGMLKFLNQQDNRYPNFNSSSFSSGMYMDSTFIKRLQDREDPRLFIYATQTKKAKEAGKDIDDFTAYEGGDPADQYNDVNLKAAEGRVSRVNARYYQDPENEPYMILGYAEQQLILAEAAVRGWISADAASLYIDGVKASFKFYETYAEAYSQYVSEDAAVDYLSHNINNFSLAIGTEAQLELIITQKYLQSFMQIGWSAYYEHLRTGTPNFRRPSGVSIPYRWMYPQSEYNYNAAQVSAAIAKQFGQSNDDIHEIPWWLK
ncbi:SusD/RagB family nutrient-binding outer membrane lipoprotein [Fulvivirga sediminis]|uniref:SusD/RagB family nutrient-binding outer membrane lipoprotein n=1 Tax=Fulvivirga sediminis TaxID=2803949 RepID=A0A937F6W6_9BACT|nr:SusD/RagB family nutrient-binding outer membrane lipoprotein [Fulvivirga sediminis]MBL3655183.1 SusD/RagB family nutrient-binding outer membrane lipoprotein [Fulvivirga sediminis]